MKFFKYIHSKELILALLLTACVVIFLNPSDVYMFTKFQMYVLGVLVFVVALFSAFVVHEKSLDEREMRHMDQAGRIGYTVGISLLTLRVLVQSSLHIESDPWLIITLLVMVLSKIVARVWYRMYR